jgi:hypothetical protein
MLVVILDATNRAIAAISSVARAMAVVMRAVMKDATIIAMQDVERVVTVVARLFATQVKVAATVISRVMTASTDAIVDVPSPAWRLTEGLNATRIAPPAATTIAMVARPRLQRRRFPHLLRPVEVLKRRAFQVNPP